MRAQSKIHRLTINPVIYAELMLAFSTIEALDRAVHDLGLAVIEIPRPALFLKGKAFARYRHAGGRKGHVLADFSIGAQAAVLRYPILTREFRRYNAFFASLDLITPDGRTVRVAAAPARPSRGT